MQSTQSDWFVNVLQTIVARKVDSSGFSLAAKSFESSCGTHCRRQRDNTVSHRSRGRYLNLLDTPRPIHWSDRKRSGPMAHQDALPFWGKHPRSPFRRNLGQAYKKALEHENWSTPKKKATKNSTSLGHWQPQLWPQLNSDILRCRLVTTGSTGNLPRCFTFSRWYDGTPYWKCCSWMLVSPNLKLTSVGEGC